MKYGKILHTLKVSQNRPLLHASPSPKSAHARSGTADDWKRLRRFLILGSEGGTYHAAERLLTIKNTEAVQRCIHEDGARVVREIVAVMREGRAPKDDPALFTLALCAGLGDDRTHHAAFTLLPEIARTGVRLLRFAQYIDRFHGWDRGLRHAIAAWYEQIPVGALVDQVVTPPQQEGWSHRDLLCLANPQTDEPIRDALYHWIREGWENVGEAPHSDEILRKLWAFERLKRASDAHEAARLVAQYHLPMEAVPKERQGREVWEAALPHSELMFLLQHLGSLSRVGILAPRARATVAAICNRITDAAALRDARIHPLQILLALALYKQGERIRGKSDWAVMPEVVDALDAAFYAAFRNVGTAGKRWVLALDVSGSMGWGTMAGMPGLTPRMASAAMAMVACQTEPAVEVLAFCDRLVRIDLSERKRIEDVVHAVEGLPFGSTDCALPLYWALENRIEADTFVIYTDSETWSGETHPSQALREYRDQTGIPARLIVVGMAENEFTIADPRDSGMLDIIGFDSSVPELMRMFAAGML